MREYVNTPSTSFDLEDEEEVVMVKRREESVSLALAVVLISLLDVTDSYETPDIWNLVSLIVTVEEMEITSVTALSPVVTE